LRQYGTESDIVGIAISAVQADNTALAAEMRKLQKAGIKIITVDGDVNREKFGDARSYYIGTDNVTGGQVLGTATKAVLESRQLESGGYVQFAGYVDNDNARSRMNGFKDSIGENYKELDRMPDEIDHAKARNNVRVAIDNFENDGLVALVGIWAYDGPAIADVVTERKVRDKYTAVTFDAAEDSITEMGEGNIDVMVVQNPFDMGAQSVKLLKAMLDDDQAVIKEMFPKAAGEPDADVYTTGLRVVVPNKDSPVKADLFDTKVVEFMDLPTFQEWLKKYDLKSS
jgi:ribose transport system substrate-binding protein